MNFHKLEVTCAASAKWAKRTLHDGWNTSHALSIALYNLLVPLITKRELLSWFLRRELVQLVLELYINEIICYIPFHQLVWCNILWFLDLSPTLLCVVGDCAFLQWDCMAILLSILCKWGLGHFQGHWNSNMYFFWGRNVYVFHLGHVPRVLIPGV